MSRFCDKCGAKINDTINFCDKCGAEVKTNNNNGNAGTTCIVVCPYCGKNIPTGETFCSKCGGSLEDNTFAVILGYIFAILSLFVGPLGFFCLIIGVYLLTKNGKAKTQGLILSIMGITALILSFLSFTTDLYILDMIGLLVMIYFILIIGGAIIWFTDTIIIK
ncbi:zinc-ribbon domain-containing protein [Methanobrevibacter sp.]|uniref:zinc ribbon domain-containing protein n=1 Tax=Methanobrevibacter sp. TaxID=66852 RepID=UPI003D7C4839